MFRTRFLAVSLFLASINVAAAEPFSSAYTSTAQKDCKLLSQGEGFSTVLCNGLNGIRVKIGESDLRFSVSYGPRADGEVAAGQTFKPLQSLSETLEWRYDEASRTRRPIATILRWHLAQQEEIPRREVLVVTRLPPGGTCWTALVDGRANQNANELARRAAEQARAFRCGVDQPAFLGKRGPGLEDVISSQ